MEEEAYAMDREKAEEIIAQQLPDFEVVAEVDPLPESDDGGRRPSLAAWSKFGHKAHPVAESKRAKLERLREKFLGQSVRPAPEYVPEASADRTTSGTLLVKRRGSNAVPKAVVVENGKIIARQG
jgi:hypothetical protein